MIEMPSREDNIVYIKEVWCRSTLSHSLTPFWIITQDQKCFKDKTAPLFQASLKGSVAG